MNIGQNCAIKCNTGISTIANGERIVRKILTIKNNKSKLIYAGSSSRWHNPLLSPYALTKHMGEEWIKMFKGVYGLNAEIVRFYNVYGPGELVDSNMSAVIGLWRAAIKKNEPI